MQSKEELMKKEYLTTNEFAAVLGVTPATVRRWDARGMLKPEATTIGGHRRYTHDQVVLAAGKNDDVLINGKKLHDCTKEELVDFIRSKLLSTTPT